MSRARHKHDKGGVVMKDESPKEVYAGKGSNVEKEAEEKKSGGAVGRKHGGKVEGTKPRHSMHKHRGRARGGSVGADKHPLSSANKGTDAVGHKADAGDADED